MEFKQENYFLPGKKQNTNSDIRESPEFFNSFTY